MHNIFLFLLAKSPIKGTPSHAFSLEKRTYPGFLRGKNTHGVCFFYIIHRVRSITLHPERMVFMFPFSLPRIFQGGCPHRCCTVGGYDLCSLHFTNVGSCECETLASRMLAQDGFDETILDPVSVAARFLNTSSVPCDFRGKPAYLKCRKCISGRTFVVLGVSCVGDAVFELASDELSCGKEIYTVCRVAFICK